MTENKRFEIREEDIIVEYHELEGLHTCIRNNGEFMTYHELVDLLNEQNETIQRLQAQLSQMEYRFFEYRDKIKSLPKDEVGEVLQKYYNQELGLFTHDTLEKIAKELGIDLK